MEEELGPLEWLLIILMPILFMQMNRPIVQKDVPGCFPDYRPGYKCMAFEKLPY